jgi:hypothetical protein
VIRNGGEVTIYSGKGIVRFQRKHGASKPHALKEVGFCPGTTIDINLRTDTIESLPERRENLEW